MAGSAGNVGAQGPPGFIWDGRQWVQKPSLTPQPMDFSLPNNTRPQAAPTGFHWDPVTGTWARDPSTSPSTSPSMASLQSGRTPQQDASVQATDAVNESGRRLAAEREAARQAAATKQQQDFDAAVAAAVRRRQDTSPSMASASVRATDAVNGAANSEEARQAAATRQQQDFNAAQAAEVRRQIDVNAAQAAESRRQQEIESARAAADTNAANASVRSQAARDKMIGQIPGLMASFTGDSSGGAPGGTGGVDPQAARDAAFGRAKDKIGQIQRSSMTSLREGLGTRGLLGGGQEAASMASLLGEGQGQLSDVVSNQMNADLANQNEIANRNYAGALTRRGQDTAMRQSLLSLVGSSAF